MGAAIHGHEHHRYDRHKHYGNEHHDRYDNWNDGYHRYYSSLEPDGERKRNCKPDRERKRIRKRNCKPDRRYDNRNDGFHWHEHHPRSRRVSPRPGRRMSGRAGGQHDHRDRTETKSSFQNYRGAFPDLYSERCDFPRPYPFWGERMGR